MSETKSRVLERASFFNGQKSGNPPQTLKPEDCETVKNYLTRRNVLERVFGTTQYATLSGTGKVGWLDLLNYRWIAQQGTDLFAESAEASASFTSVKTLSSSADIVADKYRGEMYLVNGTDQLVYPIDGTIRNLGLNGPIGTAASAAGWTRGTSGTLTLLATYRITFTIYDPINNVESPAFNVRPNEYGVCTDLTPGYFSITLVSTEVDFTIPATAITTVLANTFNGTLLRDSARGTKVRIYVSGPAANVNGLIFRLASEKAISGLTDTQILTEVTGVLLPTNNIPPPNTLRQQESYAFQKAGSIQSTYTVPSTVAVKLYESIAFFRDTMFGVGPRGVMYDSTNLTAADVKYDSVLYIHEPFQPDYVFDTREVANGDGQKTTGVAVLRDSVLIISKESSLYYLSGTTVDNYIVRVLDSRRGFIGRKTIQSTPFGVFGLDAGGVIQVSAVAPAEVISEDIEDIIKRINYAEIENAYSSYDAEANRYYLALPVDGASFPNITVVYNCKDKSWSQLFGQEGGAIKFGIASSKSFNYKIGAYIGGYIYDNSLETVVTNNGNSIDSEYFSGPFYFGDNTKKKKAKFLYITAESSTDWTIDLDVVPDLSQTQAYQLTGINSNSLFSVYAASLADVSDNVGVWDTSLWSGEKIRKTIKIPILGVGYSFQVRIRNTSTDASQYGFRILALSVEAVMLGK